MSQVSLTINGRVYRMACEDGEEDHIAQLGVRFDAAIEELRDALGHIGDDRLMVMAGILMTDRLDDAERRLQRAEQENRELRESRRESHSRTEKSESDLLAGVEAAAARIERLARRLQEAIAHSGDRSG